MSRAPFVELYLASSHWKQSFGLYAVQRLNDVRHHFPFGATEPEPVDERIDPEPLVKFSPEVAQSLMDQLWENGFRPKAVMTADATNRAQAEHLDDMRTIAFAKLGIDPVRRERKKP